MLPWTSNKSHIQSVNKKGNRILHINSMNIPHAEAVTKHLKSQQRQTTPQLYKPGTEKPA